MTETSASLEKADVRRGPGGRWLPGQAPKVFRPKGSRNALGLLNDALKKVEQGRAKQDVPCTCSIRYKLAPCKTLDQHFAQMAFLDATVLTAVQKKRIPDLSHQTGSQPASITIAYGHERRVTVAQPLPQEANGH